MAQRQNGPACSGGAPCGCPWCDPRRRCVGVEDDQETGVASGSSCLEDNDDCMARNMNLFWGQLKAEAVSKTVTQS